MKPPATFADLSRCGIFTAAEIEEMLTPERCESFAFSRPVSTKEAQHVEELYLSSEFKRDKEAVTHFLTQAGTVMKKSLGAPPYEENARGEVEGLLRDMGVDAERVLAFLSALSNMLDLAPKQGQATRDDCKR